MKFDFAKKLSDARANVRSTIYDFIIVIDEILTISRDSIDGITEDIGISDPKQNETEFLANQNLFNPRKFDRDILIWDAVQFLDFIYDEFKLYTQTNELDMSELSILQFIAARPICLPSAYATILNALVKFEWETVVDNPEYVKPALHHTSILQMA